MWVGFPQGEIPMESVHGISVSGGSFPASIWRLYMQRAVGPSSPLDWTEPSEMPVWEPWERGDDVLSYDPCAPPPAPSTTEETTTEEQPAEDQPADDDSGNRSESPPPPPASPD